MPFFTSSLACRYYIIKLTVSDGGTPVEEKSTYDMETFALKLQRAIEAMTSSACCIHHSPIVIQSYVGVTSLLHNKTGMGFFKVRGKFSF